ncbi:MAG: RDD family protein [Planctomycetia bacterium]|nr:RDD family protein [Planctomycetia bacterium]
MNGAIKQLDNRIEIVTPENIEFTYRVAGPFRRLGAYLLDNLLCWVFIIVICIITFLVFGVLQSFGTVALVGLVAHFFTTWFYGGVFESLWNGQTLGKRMFGLRVLSEDGQPINGIQAIGRNFLRHADTLPWAYWTFEESPIPLSTLQLGLLFMFVYGNYQRLGDWAAGTMVVLDEPQQLYGVARVTEPAVLQLATQLPVNLVVNRSLGRALSAYVQRRLRVPVARRFEMASHLGEALRERYNLPANTNYDLLLCAVYHRAFIASATEVLDEARPMEVART